jgi:hypothetical protein
VAKQLKIEIAIGSNFDPPQWSSDYTYQKCIIYWCLVRKRNDNIWKFSSRHLFIQQNVILHDNKSIFTCLKRRQYKQVSYSSGIYRLLVWKGSWARDSVRWEHNGESSQILSKEAFFWRTETLSLNFFCKLFVYCLSLLYRQPEKLRQRWKFRVFIHLLH